LSGQNVCRNVGAQGRNDAILIDSCQSWLANARIGASTSLTSIATNFSDTKAKTKPIVIDTAMLIRAFVTTRLEHCNCAAMPGRSVTSAVAVWTRMERS
jgi:hypothetical protein